MFFLTLKQSYSQTFYDALRLKSYLSSIDGKFKNTTSSRDEIAAILRNYSSNVIKNNAASTVATVMHDFDNNLFLKPFIPGGYYAGGVAGTSGLIGSIGGLDVTAFADGLAQFLVERTKEELNEAFFRKFAAFLNYYPEFKTLFPNTNVFVNSFNSWEYANLINTLREAFDKDIKELLSNFIKLKDLTNADCPQKDENGNKDKLCDECAERMNSISDFFKSNGGLFLLAGVQIGSGILQNQKIPDIINSVTQNDFLLGYTNRANPALESDLKNSLKLLNIISLSLKSNETGRHYITEAEFKLLKDDAVLQQLYLGLLYQQIANAQIKINEVTVTDVIKPGNVAGVINYCTNLFNESKNLQTAFNNLSTHKLEGKTDLSVDYSNIFETTNKLFQAVSATNIIDPRLQCPKELNEAFNISSKTLQIAHDIAVRNYNAAVVGTLKLIHDQADKYNTTHTDSRVPDFAATFLKYGSFASNVVLSKDPEEVKEAIKSFALPAGSSSIKKHTQFNISVNAYTGFVYGRIREKDSINTYTIKASDGKDSIVGIKKLQAIGVFAPVGIGLNWGLGWRYRNPWSLSAFVSLIDIGAIVGYRFITDEGELSNKFKVNLSNIFAPGCNIILGLPNMPLSVGAGVQYIPTLQRDQSSNEFFNLDHSGLRYQVFIALDLPLLNIHTSKANLLYRKKIKR